MKFISWNVNGIRACVNKGFLDYFNEMDADFSVSRKRNASQDRLTFNWKDIINTGIRQ